MYMSTSPNVLEILKLLKIHRDKTNRDCLVLTITVTACHVFYWCSLLRFFYYKAFSHDVTAAMLAFQNKGMAAMIAAYQTNPPGIELYFLCKHFPLFQ